MEVCRVCLKKGVLTSIYEKDLNNVTLSDKIMECGGVLIRPSMELPEYICSKCLSSLDVAYSFRTTCKKSDSILQIYLKANNTNNIFLTLSSGRTYKLPEDLKLKIVKVKKDENQEIDKNNALKLTKSIVNIEVGSKVNLETDPLATDVEVNLVSDNNIAASEANRNDSIAEEECPLNEDYDEDNHADDEFCNDTDNEIMDNDNVENMLPESIEMESSKSKEENTPSTTLKTKRNILKQKKSYVPLKKIINRAKASLSSKYIGYISTSEDEQHEPDPDSPHTTTEVKEKPTRRPDDKPSFICEICGNIYKQNSLLQTHMRRHNNERPFSCEICGKSFVTSSLMARHIKIHTGHKPFKCQFCNRRFYERGTCRAHEKVHSGDRPYQCGECGKRFIYSQSLTKHTLIHTGEKLFSCEVCGKEFRLYHHLKAHLQTNVHKNSISEALN